MMQRKEKREKGEERERGEERRREKEERKVYLLLLDLVSLGMFPQRAGIGVPF